MPLRRPSGDPLIAPESWRRPAWGARRRPARCRSPRGAAWTPARAARARVTGRRRQSHSDAKRPCRDPVAAWAVAGWLRARPVRGQGQGPDVAPAPPARPLPAGGQLAWAMTPRRRRWVHMTPSLLGEDQGVGERCLAATIAA